MTETYPKPHYIFDTKNKMKEIRTIFGMTAFLFLAGCSGSVDEPQRSDEPVPVKLTCSELSVSGAETRAATNAHSSLNGDEVNIYMPSNTLSGPIVYTIAAAAGADGKSAMTPPSTVYLYPDYTPIYGFHPTAATMSGTTMTFTVQLDQSSAESYKLSDLLFAKNEIYKSNITTPVNLEFHHLMSKIIVNVEADETVDLTGVWLVNVNKTISFTPSSYTIDHTTATGLNSSDNVGENDLSAAIRAGTSSGAYTMVCAALIPPQNVRGKNLIVIGGKGFDGKASHQGTVTYAIPNHSRDEIKFLPGKTYTLTLKIDRWSFGQTLEISVSDWSNNDNPIDVGEPRLSI